MLVAPDQRPDLPRDQIAKGTGTSSGAGDAQTLLDQLLDLDFLLGLAVVLPLLRKLNTFVKVSVY